MNYIWEIDKDKSNAVIKYLNNIAQFVNLFQFESFLDYVIVTDNCFFFRNIRNEIKIDLKVQHEDILKINTSTINDVKAFEKIPIEIEAVGAGHSEINANKSSTPNIK